MPENNMKPTPMRNAALKDAVQKKWMKTYGPVGTVNLQLYVSTYLMSYDIAPLI